MGMRDCFQPSPLSFLRRHASGVWSTSCAMCSPFTVGGLLVKEHFCDAGGDMTKGKIFDQGHELTQGAGKGLHDGFGHLRTRHDQFAEFDAVDHIRDTWLHGCRTGRIGAPSSAGTPLKV